MLKKHATLITSFLFSVALFLMVMIPSPAAAQTIPVTQLSGYAWSENIGWISMSCKDGGASGQDICLTRNYGVTINANRTVTGYAWSEHIGWVRFGGLSSFPVGGGTTAANASVSGTYPNLTFTGWARACAGTASGPNGCSNMADNTNSGGWDGWISLGGTGYSARTNAAGMQPGSWAWGSAVVGWIDMTTNVSVSGPTASLDGAGCPIPIGASTCQGTFTWTFTNAANRSVRNVATGANYGSSISATNALHDIRYGPNLIEARDGSIVLDTALVTGTCANYNTSTNICEVVPTPAPTISLSITPGIVRSGQTTSLNWTITGMLDGSCSVTGPGTNQTGITASSGSLRSGALTSYSRFVLRCTGTYGTVEATSAVEVIPVSQEV